MSIRITGGEYKGIKLTIPRELDAVIRPTQDKVRLAIFSSLTSKIDLKDLKVLDLFSGSGIMSFEALSRGASTATMVDLSKLALRVSFESAKKLKIEGRINQVCSDCLSSLGNLGHLYDLVFIDPPYRKFNMEGILLELINNSILSSSGIVVYEEDLDFFNSQYQQSRDIINAHFSNVTLKNYGSTSVAFLKI